MVEKINKPANTDDIFIKGFRVLIALNFIDLSAKITKLFNLIKEI